MVQNNNQDNSQDNSAEDKPVLLEKGEMGEFFKTAAIAILIALVIRSILFEPFNIPSGSMKPTLLVGDYLFVNKPAYGYSRYSFPFALAPIENRIFAKKPKRGDVVVFALPSNDGIDYIKRIVGLPGDDIQVMRGRLFINDRIIPRELVETKEITKDNGEKQDVNEYIETLPGDVKHRIYEVSDDGRLDNTLLYTVPKGHYFMMGDNRDNSTDSRVIDQVGPIPFENIIGRADFLFFSTNSYAHLFEVWKWPWSIRYDRLFLDIDPKRPKEEGGVSKDNEL
ncbi:MAG: signal peptidase I [Alphaproteobacteria bacterium]|nr:signal peptidase I [Alphaproteobacteria bacterium]